MTAIRASDAERERIAQILQQAAGDGRLTPEEAGERLALASAARHRDELARLVSDLPDAIEPRRPPPARRWGGYWGWALRRGLRLAVLAAVFLMLWRTGAWMVVAFWPLIFVGLAFGMLRRTRRRFGWWRWEGYRGQPWWWHAQHSDRQM